MNLQSLRQSPATLRQPLQEMTFSKLKGGEGLGGQQMQALLEGAQALMQSLQKIQKLMESMKSGGLQKAGGAQAGGAGAPAPSPFESSSFTPCGGKAPVELNPADKCGTVAPGGAAPSAGAASSGGVSPTGDAKLGAGMPPALNQYKGAIESAAQKTGVPASMLAAQIWQESRGNLSATSTNGGNGLTDTGLMQMNPNTFKELQGKYPELQGKNLSDPETNILAGACYMKDMKEQFGSWDLALRAYNSGPNGVDKSNPHAIPAGTGDATYVQKVQQFANTIATGQGSLPA